MKEWKEKIVEAMIDKTKDRRIISLRETAAEMGIEHVKTEDCLDILNALKNVPGYRPIQIMMNPRDSLFVSLNLVDNELEFDNEEQY